MTRTEKNIWLRGVTAGLTFAGFCGALIHNSPFWIVLFWTVSGCWQVYRLMFPKETTS